MKARYTALPIMLATAILSQSAIADDGGRGRIPLPTGQFSITTQGSLALCLNPSTFAEESCGTAGVLVYPITLTVAGVETRDATGNACATETQVSGALPPSASPSNINSKAHLVNNLLDYDAATGIGDNANTGYTGGTCVGANFDSTGATVVSTGTVHFG
jgi:hypothetical protein